MLYLLVFRVFSSVIFAAMNVGQSASLAPDYGKAKMSAQRIFQLLDRKPLIDSYSKEGEKLVRFFCRKTLKQTELLMLYCLKLFIVSLF